MNPQDAQSHLTLNQMQSGTPRPPNCCAVCDKTAQKRCAQCKMVQYCGQAHQKKHWKIHKKDCVRAVQQLATSVEDLSKLRDTECPVCLCELKQAVQLPCSHAMCQGCLRDLRKSQVGTVCPLCRAKLPPGPETLFDDASTYGRRADRAQDGPIKENLLRHKIKLYEAAAAQGSPRAQSNLGSCYQGGRGVVQDLERAVQLYEAAASQHEAIAQANLGGCYAQGIGVPQNLTRAVEMYTAAADQGYAPAQYNLGMCYAQGDGTAQNQTRAVELYKAAADQGNDRAQHNLGGCYYRGFGVEQDLGRAIELWEASAAQQNPQAQYNLAACYAQGNGIAQNQSRAVELWEAAASQGVVLSSAAQAQVDAHKADQAGYAAGYAYMQDMLRKQST